MQIKFKENLRCRQVGEEREPLGPGDDLAEPSGQPGCPHSQGSQTGQPDQVTMVVKTVGPIHQVVRVLRQVNLTQVAIVYSWQANHDTSSI